jgi:hypothetical protein
MITVTHPLISVKTWGIRLLIKWSWVRVPPGSPIRFSFLTISVTSDRKWQTWQRLLFYRATNDNGPWDVISVSPEAFLTFLEAWAAFLSRGFAREVLAASEAA